jgi:hypothetical protein
MAARTSASDAKLLVLATDIKASGIGEADNSDSESMVIAIMMYTVISGQVNKPTWRDDIMAYCYSMRQDVQWSHRLPGSMSLVTFV